MQTTRQSQTIVNRSDRILPCLSLASLLLASLLLASCAGAPSAESRAANVVVVPVDLHFIFRNPGNPVRQDILLSAGRYVRRSEDEGTVTYYSAEGGLVSGVPLGEPPNRVAGGVGFRKRNGTYFVWKTIPSFNMRYPLNGIDDQASAAPDVPAYLATIPADLVRTLRLE